jgi:hypothetical protein
VSVPPGAIPLNDAASRAPVDRWSHFCSSGCRRLQRLPPAVRLAAGADFPGRSYPDRVILFPIALVWLVIALVWIIRNSTNEPEPPEQGQSWRRFVPRVPRRPWNDGPRHGQARSKSARSR